MFSADDISNLVDYNHETGKLIWLPRLHNFGRRKFRHAGKMAFNTTKPSGYKQGNLLGKTYYAHRVAWAIYYGSWPNKSIDHINGIKTDNRISNLRLAEDSENQYNKTRQSNNTSGYKGVSWSTSNSGWIAQIRHGRVSECLGTFKSAELAHNAYKKAADRLHGEYKNYG